MGVLADRVRAVVPAIVATGPARGTGGGGAVDGGPVGPRGGVAGPQLPVRLGRQRRRAEPARPRPAGKAMKRKNLGWGLFFLLPSAIPLFVFTLVPMVSSLWVSLHKWNLISPMEWVGLGNYTNLLTDENTRRVFLHTLIYVAGYLPIVYAGGLGLALALNQKLKGRSFLRATYFLPVVTSWVVVALVWKWLLN